MSEWEEFCESNGCNAGSEEDNDYLYESLDEPRFEQRREIEEIQPSLGRDEMVLLLIEAVVTGAAGLSYGQQIPSQGSYDTVCLDNWPDVRFPDLILNLGYNNLVPVSFLIDVMRTEKIPLFESEGSWIAWDPVDQRLKVATHNFEPLWPRESSWRGGEPTDIDREPDEAEINLQNLLRRFALSTDHGMKPLLIHRDYLDEAMRGREVEVQELRTIPGEAIADYALVHCDPDGRPQWLPLKQAVKQGFPLYTRTGTYRLHDKGITPLLNYGKLLADAFQFATTRNPNEFEWFVAKKRVSIFNAAINRIDGPPENVDFDDSEEVTESNYALYRAEGMGREFTTWKNSAIENALSIKKWASEIGAIYITSSGHPLESKLVTTPDLYHHALKALSVQGYKVEYHSGRGVEVKKPSDPTFGVNF